MPAQPGLRISSTCITLFILSVIATPVLSPAETLPAAPVPHYDYENDIFHPIHARNGMVASEQKLASQIGADILKRGGNAVDAAVATAFALAVVLPNAGNLGGGGFMMFHDSETGKDIALDFRETAPAKASRNMYLDGKGNVVEGRSLYTPLAVGVPGTVAGMEYALKNWGTMSLAQVIAPSIRLARDGFPVSEDLAYMLAGQKEHMEKWASTRAIFFKEGQPLKAGDRLVQKDLAQSLSLIAKQGSKAFYHGKIGEKIIAEIRNEGGLMSREDLENYQVKERTPVMGTYRGYQIVSMPPPSSGGTHIIEILNLLERYPLSTYGSNSAQTIHYLAEAMKLAYVDRAQYLGDPDFVHVPVAALTSKRYADRLARAIDPVRVLSGKALKAGRIEPYESPQTTHFSIVDKDGNAVAMTYTLNMDFGSGIVATGTGILLNDEMDDFSAKPGIPNAYGVTGNEANSIAPGKRPLSSMSPTIVLKNGKIWAVTGSPGGSRIITTTLQTIIDMIDFGMNPAEAASTPRIHHQWLPDILRVEKGISPDTLQILSKEGYVISQEQTMGRVQIIQVRDDGLYGYSDPRNPDGAAVGY